ncbi:MAG: alpha/beta hydrolase [Gemmatimonadetes bacterium]|nr:alpha/beta hydrolase [Gemmatimonadota bacterium]
MAASGRNIHVIEGPRSWHNRALNALMRLMLRSPLRYDADIVALRRRYEQIDARHFQIESWVTRERVSCDGVAADWISVPESRPERVLFYLHGGSFAFRYPNTHARFAARLCRQLQARALMPDYRLAPEHPYPAAPDDCATAYRWLLAKGVDPRQLVLVGDSAGGNLVLVTVQRAVRAQTAMPACAVLLSPAVDCTLSSPSMADNVDVDPLMRLSNLLVVRHHYAPSPTLYHDPDVSPLFGDFTGFPPLLLQTGSTEILRDEAVRVAEKASAAGVDVELEIWPETPHVFQIVPFLPESAQAAERIAGFVRARTGWDRVTPAPAETTAR